MKNVLTEGFFHLQGGKLKSWMIVLTICGSILILALVIGLGIACLRRKKDRGDFYNYNLLTITKVTKPYKNCLIYFVSFVHSYKTDR